MKKIIFTFCLFLFAFISRGQNTFVLYHEDFEVPDSVTNIPSTGPGWADDQTLYVSGAHSYHATIAAAGDTNILETTSFDPGTLGLGFITLSFKHIAKVDFFDRCIIEYSLDGGGSWTRYDTTNSIYIGSSSTWPTYASFMAPSYPVWAPSQPTLTPDNTWWVTETFDISTTMAFSTFDARIRFKMYDNNGNGGAQNYGWNIEDINIVGAYCELDAPVMSQSGNLSGVVYNGGPFTVNYTSTDASGIGYGWLIYTVTDSLGNVTGPDSVALTNPGGNTWAGQIPAINEGDTVCYYGYTVDNSGCGNYTYIPTNGGCTSFYFGTATGFPYCNNFDNIPDTTWSVSTISGSAWEQGVPTTAPTNSTYSGAGCWDVDLNAVYQPSTEAYLYSPLIAWSGVNVKLSFYQNRDVEQGWDGVVLHYDTMQSGNWVQVGGVNDPDGTNWYNTGSINSNTVDTGFWDGNSSGWQYSDIVLKQLNGLQPGTIVQFRFEFTSDGSVQNTGFSIDEFCLKLPQLFDAGVTSITQPTPEVPAGSSSPVTVTVKNFGITPLNAGDFNIAYTINGTLSGSIPYAGAQLGPGVTSAPITLPNFTVPSGTFDLCAFTALPNDGDVTNDTLCTSILGVPTFIPPYCDNFDTIPAYWNGTTSINGNTAWELGVPANGIINTAKSAPNVWITNLSTFYGNNVDAELRSPYFDFSSVGTFNSNISFWMNRNIQSNSDGLILEYTTNNGNTWSTLGTNGLGTNWYNNVSTGPNFTGPGWDGNTGGWVRCEYPVAILNGTPSVRFRFHFESDFFGNAEGAAIDNFCVKPPVPNDAGVKRIISPGPQVNAGANIVPTVVVKNFGNNVLTTFPVTYRVNGIVGGTGTYTGTLNPGDSANFNSWPAFSAPSCSFVFDAYTELPADGDLTNDTSAANCVGVPVVIIPSSGSVCENFDTNSCWTSTPSLQGNTKWELGTPNFGVTNSAFSAPNSWDINLNTAYENSALAYLYTSKYDFTNAVNATLSFWHNWSTENGWDGVRVEVDSNGSGNWYTLGTGPTDPNGVNWYNNDFIQSSQQQAWDATSSGAFGVPLWIKSSHNLDSLSGKSNVQFRFVFTSDGSVTGDGHSIDDFCIRTPFPHDIGVSSVIRPGPLEGAGNVLAPQVVIKNYGSNSETTSPVVYKVNNGTAFSFTWTGNLAPNQTDTVTLPTFPVPANNFLFCAWTELVGDGDLTNDTLCGNSFGVPVVIPTFADDFDSTVVNFVNVPGGSGATNWELGAPNFGQTNSVHSAPNCWDVNLNITYGNNDSCFLYTPIFNLSGKKAPVFRFWHNRNLDNFNGDGVFVQYTVNGGTTWKILGNAGLSAPQAVNWYNSANIFSSGTPGWNGSSAGWIFSYLALDTTIFNGAPNSQAQFRFVFKSDGFTQVDGFSVDDFELFIPKALTVSPQIIKPVNKLVTPGPQFIRALIRNKGTQTVNTANVTLKIDSTVIVTDAVTFSPGLQGSSYTVQGGAQYHVFSLPWNADPGLHSVCVYTDSPNTGLDEELTDDTLCVSITVFDSISVTAGDPYCTDFEAGPQWVTLNAVTFNPPNNPGVVAWDLGTPAKACLNSTHSGVQAWSTDLNANYPNRDTSALFTPVFNVDPTKCYKFSFWHKYDTEQFQDGGNVESSSDSGNTWQLVGFGGEPNWYNSTFVTGLGGVPPRAGFSGTNCTWSKAEHEIQPVGGTLIFRFRFGSDFSFSKEGWEVDDVCFEELTVPCVLGVPDGATLNGLSLGQNHPNPANTETTFDYTLPSSGQVDIHLTNMIGQVISNPVSGNQMAGSHAVTINTASLSPGIYMYTLKFNDYMLVKKMVITK